MQKAISKITILLTLVTLLFIYGAVILFAAPAFTPGQTLDPVSVYPNCGPGLDNLTGDDCTVGTGWTLDLANDYVYNTIDQVGIGMSPDDLPVDFSDAIFATEGPSYLNYEYDVDKAGSIILDDSVLGFPGVVLGHHVGDFYSNTGVDSVLFLSQKHSGFTVSDLIGGTGASASISMRNEMADGPTGDGMNAVFQAKADDATSRRYGISMYTGGQYDKIGISEYDPVFDMSTKSIQINDGQIDTIYNYNIIDDTDYSYHESRIEDDGFSWKYAVDRTTSDEVMTLELNDNLTLSSDTAPLADTLFEVDSMGGIFSAALEGTGTRPLSADANGNIIETPSDEKLKTNIEDLDDSLERVLELKPVSYTWEDPQRFGDQIEIGFIAQDIEEVVPEVVREGKEYKSVNYQVLTALNAGAIKELATQINDRALRFIDDVREILVRKVTTDELCIGDVCFDEEEAEHIKELIEHGDIDWAIEQIEDETEQGDADEEENDSHKTEQNDTIDEEESEENDSEPEEETSDIEPEPEEGEEIEEETTEDFEEESEIDEAEEDEVDSDLEDDSDVDEQDEVGEYDEESVENEPGQTEETITEPENSDESTTEPIA